MKRPFPVSRQGGQQRYPEAADHVGFVLAHRRDQLPGVLADPGFELRNAPRGEGLVDKPAHDRVTRRVVLDEQKARQPLGEADFRESIALAQKQGAKAWELRSAMSLARILREHGDYTAAHTLLDPIYRWLSEGFDTADLKDAKALLDELSDGEA